MAADRAEIWIQEPKIIVQHPDDQIQNPAPLAQDHEQLSSPDALLLGMMLWMEQGLLLDGLHLRWDAPAEKVQTKPEPKKEPDC